MRIKLKLVLVNVSLVLIALLGTALAVSRQVEGQQLADSRTRLAEVGALVASDLREKERVYRAKAGQFSSQADVVLYAQALVHFGPLFARTQREQTRRTLERTLGTLRIGTDLEAVEIWEEAIGQVALSAEAGSTTPIARWVVGDQRADRVAAVTYQAVPGGLVLAVTAPIRLEEKRLAYLQLRRFVGPDFVSDVARSSGTEIALFAGGRYAVGTLGGLKPPGNLGGNGAVPLVVRQTIRGVPYQVTFQRLGSIGGQDIVLAAALSAQPIMRRTAQATRAIFGVALLAVLGCSSLIYFWAGAFLRPVNDLMAGTDQVQQGNLETEIPVQTRDELGQLAQRFNEMTRSLRNSRDELVRSEKLVSVGKLSAGVAHEINNPLGTIINYLDLLLEDAQSAQIREPLEQMLTESRRIKQIVRELLDFARQSPTKAGPVQINAVLGESLNLVLLEHRASSVRVERRLQPGLPDITGDPNKLKQVFINIILNALQAMPGGGVLSVGTREVLDENGGRSVRIIFRDNGIGIPGEHLKYVFDPFFTTKGVGEGTGLGLSVSYGIVQAHGGTIHLDSTAGRGTEVSVQLPVRTLPAEEETAVGTEIP